MANDGANVEHRVTHARRIEVNYADDLLTLLVDHDVATMEVAMDQNLRSLLKDWEHFFDAGVSVVVKLFGLLALDDHVEGLQIHRDHVIGTDFFGVLAEVQSQSAQHIPDVPEEVLRVFRHRSHRRTFDELYQSEIELRVSTDLCLWNGLAL